jgi:hypothetical protein
VDEDEVCSIVEEWGGDGDSEAAEEAGEGSSAGSIKEEAGDGGDRGVGFSAPASSTAGLYGILLSPVDNCTAG